MKFHLNHHPKKFDFELKHGDKIIFVGSCFSENMAAYFRDLRFSILNNPYGILFNPLSINTCFFSILENKEPDEKLVLESEEAFYYYMAHSSVKAKSKAELLKLIQNTQQNSFDFIKHSNCLVLSFGTAFVYALRESGLVVGNCHKQPQQLFEKRFVEPEEIARTYSLLLQKLRQINPTLRVLFTVSPVKYLKDGIENNALSKASLLMAVHTLVKENALCYYFPAYELLTDDLRDYRFYKEDLAHPNQQAIQYIWEKFSKSIFSEQSLRLHEEITKLNTALQHRNRSSSMKGAKKLSEFVEVQKKKILALEPGIDFPM